MKTNLLTAIAVIGSLAAGSANNYAAEDHHANQGISLSPPLLNLLRTEMRELASGVQGIPLSLATGDWKSIHATSVKIRDSYIMAQELTPAQASELGEALPEHFKHLDAEFHHRAEKLAEAAAAHDPERVAFQYSRLLESCAGCHSAFASERFPGFARRAPQGHHH